MMWWLFPATAVYMMVGGFVGGVIEEQSDEEGWVGLFWPLVILFWVVAGFWKLGATVQGLPRARRERAASAARARALRAAKARKRSKELEKEMGLQPLPVVPASADGDEGPPHVHATLTDAKACIEDCAPFRLEPGEGLLHVGNCGVTPHRREDCELPRRDLSPEPDLLLPRARRERRLPPVLPPPPPPPPSPTEPSMEDFRDTMERLEYQLRKAAGY